MKSDSKKSTGVEDDPLEYLLSDPEDETVRQVRIEDKCSVPKCVSMLLQGVAATDLIDSGADITIMGGELFKKIAALAKLRKWDFKKADKIPKTYDQRSFVLDGRLDLDLEFDGKVLHTPVYVKMDPADQLLLSEGVCRQLGVITYQPKVHPVNTAKTKFSF